MVDAPASPIATQKMASAATPAAELERQMMSWSEPKNEREWWALHEIERLRGRNAEVNMLAHGWMVAHGMLAAGKPYKLPTPADLPEVLSSAERRNEELVNAAERHRDMLKQLLDEANARHFDAAMRAEAAESALASLTGQVGEMREALEKIADLGEHRAANAPTYARAAIATSPPGISTTGGDGGTRTSQL